MVSNSSLMNQDKYKLDEKQFINENWVCSNWYELWKLIEYLMTRREGEGVSAWVQSFDEHKIKTQTS